ncbi:hypothetical protein NKT34_06125 [Paenibacillus polysaccharolyticus]|uniref:hypothetical protein n=1 Tax=Paenibacillus TaxID=44249 RepID=UPI0016499FC5|nr:MULTISPECIES: hypothetical protein [Paenibacillus]MCP1132857.1 hypothetical protein [Paenibacillus polysaccharolyticus]
MNAAWRLVPMMECRISQRCQKSKPPTSTYGFFSGFPRQQPIHGCIMDYSTLYYIRQEK